MDALLGTVISADPPESAHVGHNVGSKEIGMSTVIKAPAVIFKGDTVVQPKKTVRKTYSPTKAFAPTHPTKRRRLGEIENDLFIKAYTADPMDVVYVIKKGVEPGVIDAVAARMKVSKERLLITLGLARATTSRKASKSQTLSPDASSRVFGIARLIGQVEAMVNESGDPSGFDAAQWVAQWLEQSLPALDGRKPAEFMDTAEGQQLVSRLLAQAQSGAYA